MAFNLNSLLRPHIASLKPYTSARDEYTGTEGIFLDANENPLGSATEEDFNRYPDPYQWEIKKKLSKIKGVRPEQIFLGNGSDEAIDLLFRAFCNPGKDNVILLPPTYGMYEVSAAINDVLTKKVSLTEEFQIDPKEVLHQVDEHTKIIFICSPNNPSGNKIKRDSIYEILNQFQGLVVIDEAYIDFNDEPSFTLELDKFPNLLVMQTLSKAWGLASLRLGMAFASEELIRILNRIKPPYNISGLTQEYVLKALQNEKKVKAMIQTILEEKNSLEYELRNLDFVQKIYPSNANFFLVKVPKATEFYNQLIDQKIIVRNRSKVQLCEDCLRITIGKKSENEALIKTMKRVAEEIGIEN
ncbi:MAG: histidinol-phosphate transaminase [Algoriphagus sp.]|uniref:histidinol-phosphate transaminase n=1 Tax=Algoriphagus sp. TaxID=1872435 RepID=UPI0018414705|nr:histidinol-phosphate transaminase [Algoriphagus sp.]NVJ86028.1 histidinol-phosphate transaminase [Algoriphagus sp.]